MGSFGGFYKGDKKKKKKDAKGGQQDYAANRPIFVAPKIIEKKKKEY